MRDSHQRSIYKGVTWRAIGTLDTAVLSYVFTGDFGHAFKIAGAELVSKIGLFYLHERIWMQLKIGRKEVRMQDGSYSFAEAQWRSFVKGISWRITGTLDTILWATLVTGNFAIALKIGGAEIITKVLLYYFHERCWLRVSWGRLPHNLVPVTKNKKETELDV